MTMTPEQIEAMRADMAAGTRGPWRCYMTTNGGKLIGIGDAEGGGVADCGFGLWRGGKERDANARRIANVPLMEATILAQAEQMERMREALATERKNSNRLWQANLKLINERDRATLTPTPGGSDAAS